MCHTEGVREGSVLWKVGPGIQKVREGTQSQAETTVPIYTKP